VSHHGAVQPVLSHDAAPPPRLRGLPLLGPPVLEPDLHQTLWNTKFVVAEDVKDDI
jgi:hypothetical protein